MCEGLCLKPVHPPCACWTVVQQREWQSLELRKLNVLFWHRVIYPAHGGIFLLQTVCACCWTWGGIPVSALRWNGHCITLQWSRAWYPGACKTVSVRLSSFGHLKQHFWTAWPWSHRQANAADAKAITSNKVLQKSMELSFRKKATCSWHDSTQVNLPEVQCLTEADMGHLQNSALLDLAHTFNSSVWVPTLPCCCLLLLLFKTPQINSWKYEVQYDFLD